MQKGVTSLETLQSISVNADDVLKKHATMVAAVRLLPHASQQHLIVGCKGQK